ncbi:MAG: AAA family ATPase [Acidobacteriaceae bacterium]
MSNSVELAEKLEAAGSRKLVMSTFTQDRDALGAKVLSIALIGPEEQRRKSMARALAGSQANVTHEFTSYPDLDDVPRILEGGYDLVVVELDSNPEHALDLVENICGNSSVTVIVYSAQADSEMLVRCMRAGAREFLTQPVAPGAIAEALVRASVRRPAGRSVKRAMGKLFVFVGAKGGSGTTTVATNFAVALTKESGESTVLIDLGAPIGDAALGLGIRAQFTTVNALQNSSRLDSNFLSKLLVKHASGLSVLAAPDDYTSTPPQEQALEKLLFVTRQDFEYVVVDAGSNIGPAGKLLFQSATTVYLISQVSVSELRNSHRLISEFFSDSGVKLEVVLNRFTPRSLGIDEPEIKKALSVSPEWKIPSDYDTALRAQNTASALALGDSTISRVIRQMARVACGLPKNRAKKKHFSLFG